MPQTYKLLYCARNELLHPGMLKVGEASFSPDRRLDTYEPNDDILAAAAKNRIRQWSGTIAASTELVYCESLVVFNENVQNYESISDNNVHRVLQNAGFPRVEFDSAEDSGREWFQIDLETVKAATKAAKEGRDYLDTSELPEAEIYPLRKEQRDAVDMAKDRFARKNDMLWHAKMRFGKTISALNLVKEEQFKRTIIITHRPVVEDGWGADFYHVFNREDKWVFVTKIQDADSIENDGNYDAAIDQANDRRLEQLVNEDKNFVYFASIQDLRGSARVGGNFNKNNIVFDTDWDLVIIDEAHEGTQTLLGQKVIDLLVKKGTKKLDLSGTAYNLLDQYTEKGSVYTWDYIQEQEAKRKWTTEHPNEKNPYADMPTMHINVFDLNRVIKEQGLDLSEKSFSFSEFFRTWTGELNNDKMAIPEGFEIGDFVHPEAVRRLLDLLSQNDVQSRFPFVTQEDCNKNVHTLWMVPGVKEAAALSKELKKHPIFGNTELFGIANIAGDGDHDEEKHFHSALEFVRKTIEKHPNTITLSCGRLTTGVTVKEWTSVFMLAGAQDSDAKQYMQTIFRVQSAGKINGEQKTDCFVYDFAPDRALTVIAESVLGSRSRKGRGGTVISSDEQHTAFEQFLDFCPVLALDGAEFKSFSVESLMSQINRVQINRAFKSGCADNVIYDNDKLAEAATKSADINKLNKIFGKIDETKGKTKLKKAGMARNGTRRQTEVGNRPPRMPQNNENRNSEKNSVLKEIQNRLTTISIRIPLLFYGGDFEIEDGRLVEVITGVDDQSWSVFMPDGLTKADFRYLAQFYNQETIIGAGKKIRAKALEADELAPTERVKAITDIFSHFHNPAKETVLTPWRIVNLQLANNLGGWCFYNEDFEENTNEYYKRLVEPRFVDCGPVTQKTLGNPGAQILEINSKSGLYPLYAAYSIYRAKMGERKESELLPEELTEIWDEAVKQVYVLCQSSMAASITKHTLIGFRDVPNNVKYDDKLLSKLKNSVENTTRKVIKGAYWGKEEGKMRFDAVVGNPPYQEDISKKQAKSNGQNRSKNIFNYFQMAADRLTDGYTSLIYPGARWIHRSGKGLQEFGLEQINDPHLDKVDFYPDAQEIFKDVSIADGISIVFKNNAKKSTQFTYVYHSKDDQLTVELNNPGEELIALNPRDIPILEKTTSFISNYNLGTINERILPQKLFGIESNFVEENPALVRAYNDGDDFDYETEIKLFTNDKAGKTGKSRWYIANKDVIPVNNQHIYKWQVIVSSANAGGQKRDSQIEIVDNHSAFGRSRVGLGSFDTEKEARNFYSYAKTFLIRFLFLMTDEALTSLGKKVPDLMDYSESNSVVNFNQDLNKQLYELVGLNEEEIAYVEKTIKDIDISRSLIEDDAES